MDQDILVEGGCLVAHLAHSLIEVGVVVSLSGLDKDVGELPLRVVHLGILQKGLRELCVIRGGCLSDTL